MTTTQPSFLTAEWRNLVMLNYEIDPELLHSRVPAGTEIDTHEGRTWASVVGFLFLDTRVRGFSIPFHRNFEELNLRFYVWRRGPEGWRRGVVFVKELVPRRAIAWVARTLYGENYVARPMRHAVTMPDGERSGRIVYEWRQRQSWGRVSASIEGEPSLPQAGSLEEFIAEHYWGYAAQRDGGTVEYQVEHPPWRVWQGSDVQFDCGVAELHGEELAKALAGRPSSAFVADGSPVVVRRGVRV